MIDHEAFGAWVREHPAVVVGFLLVVGAYMAVVYAVGGSDGHFASGFLAGGGVGIGLAVWGGWPGGLAVVAGFLAMAVVHLVGALLGWGRR